MTTQEKEMMARNFIVKFDLIRKFFPDVCRTEWITDKQKQLDGMDMVVRLLGGKKSVILDLKTGIGPDYTKGPAIETFQKTKSSNYEFVRSYEGKLTDYYLYVLYSKNLGLLQVYLLPYRYLKPINDRINFESNELTVSFNGSGKYWQPTQNQLKLWKSRFPYFEIPVKS